MKFPTKDRDHDVYADNCAKLYEGGWWYDACHKINPNDLYFSGSIDHYAAGII